MEVWWLRLVWKLKLIKVFILVPIAKVQQGRESCIHVYESVIISANLSCVLSVSAPGPPYLLKHLPSM